MARDHDLLLLGSPKVLGELILYLIERNPFHHLPAFPSQSSAPSLGTIATIQTWPSTTS